MAQQKVRARPVQVQFCLSEAEKRLWDQARGELSQTYLLRRFVQQYSHEYQLRNGLIDPNALEEMTE